MPANTALILELGPNRPTTDKHGILYLHVLQQYSTYNMKLHFSTAFKPSSAGSDIS